MKDPILLTNEEILENISDATLQFCRGFRLPEYAIEEFKKFPLIPRFIIMGILLDSLGKAQEKEDPENSKSNLDKSYASLQCAKLFLGEKDDSLIDKYYDYWVQKATEWWNSIRFEDIRFEEKFH